MTLETVTVPNGMIADCYEIDADEFGITIEHLLRDECGFEEIGSRACLMILPEALPQVIAALQRAAAPVPVVRRKLGFGALVEVPA